MQASPSRRTIVIMSARSPLRSRTSSLADPVRGAPSTSEAGQGTRIMRNLILMAALAASCAACATTSDDSSSAEISESRGMSSAPVAVQAKEAHANWDFNATIIEACSCPMFCQCYFNAQPADHPGCCPPNSDPKAAPRYCRFNNAFHVNHGSYGPTKLDGSKFWVAGDLGGDFSKGE